MLPVLKSVLIVLLSVPAIAAIDPTLRVQVEAEAVGIISAIDAVQAAHRAGRSRYWQGLRTHSTLPADGTLRTADRLTATADGAGNVSWTSKGFTFTGGTRSAYEVHEYLGPRGTGYVIIQSVVSGADTYYRVIDKGTESRSRDWEAVEVGVVSVPGEIERRR